MKDRAPQPEALRLADALADRVSLTATGFGFDADLAYAAAELRRFHAESEKHLQELRSYRITVENREARIAELEARLIAEAARPAEQKLRADQLEQQHDMQAKMHAQAAEQLAAAQQPVEVTDNMALAFHQALTDGALGADDLNDIKTGLRAALSHVQPLQKTVAAQQGVQQSIEQDVRAIVDLLKNREWAEHIGQTELGRELEHEITKLYNATHPTTEVLDAQKLHNDIMNIKAVAHIFIHEQRAYKEGHRDARHAAAELVLAAQAKQGGAA